jgi:hypothetical protein
MDVCSNPHGIVLGCSVLERIQGRVQALRCACSAPLAALPAVRISPGGLAPAGRDSHASPSVRDLLRMHSGHYRELPNSAAQ